MVQSAHCSSTPIMPGFRGLRGKPADPDVQKIQPMTYVSGDVPPLYFIHGTEDTKAPVRFLDDFVKALRDAGAKDITYKRSAAGTKGSDSQLSRPQSKTWVSTSSHFTKVFFSLIV